MFKELFNRFKVRITIKEIIMWTVLGFAGVLAVFVLVMKQELNSVTLWTTVGFTIIFVLLMIMTKSYGRFSDEFYQSYIDRDMKKQQNKQQAKKKNKKKKK